MLSLILSLAFASAPSASVEQHIARGKAALADLEYDVAAEELTLAASDRAADDEQRMRANLLAGIANRIAGRETEARLNFRYVLLHDPNARLAADTPAKVTSFFELVRQEIAAERSARGPSAAPLAAPAESRLHDVAPGFGTPALALAITGAALVLAGGGLAFTSETALDDAALDHPTKSNWLLAGRAGLVAGAVGVFVGGGGVLLGLLEPGP